MPGGTRVPGGRDRGQVRSTRNLGIDQYYETIPGASCNVAPPGSAPGSGAGQTGAHNLSHDEARGLASQGPAGRAVARFVGATAPPLPTRRATADGDHKGARAGGRPAGGAHPAPPSGRGQNPIIAALRPIVTGSGTGTGPLLPIVAGAAALLALLMVALRVRGHRGSPSGER